MKTFKTLGFTLALAGLVTAARATPINGDIWFTSDANATLNNTPSLATQIIAWGAVTVSSGATGSYSAVSGGQAVTMTPALPWTFGAVGTTGTNIVTNLWSFTIGSTTYAFDLLTLTTNGMAGSARVLEGFGTAKITGLDNTAGFFSMSTSGTGAKVSFSAYTSVPDGGSTIALLGLAMVGIAALRRRMTV